MNKFPYFVEATPIADTDKNKCVPVWPPEHWPNIEGLKSLARTIVKEKTGRALQAKCRAIRQTFLRFPGDVDALIDFLKKLRHLLREDYGITVVFFGYMPAEKVVYMVAKFYSNETGRTVKLARADYAQMRAKVDALLAPPAPPAEPSEKLKSVVKNSDGEKEKKESPSVMAETVKEGLLGVLGQSKKDKQIKELAEQKVKLEKEVADLRQKLKSQIEFTNKLRAENTNQIKSLMHDVGVQKKQASNMEKMYHYYYDEYYRAVEVLREARLRVPTPGPLPDLRPTKDEMWLTWSDSEPPQM